MVSVVIPVINEGQTIKKVVSFARQFSLVGEVIVIDDKSLDNTVEEARLAGAIVVTSTKIGKGASMRDGLLLAKHEVILYLDGDVENYAPDTIEKMTLPIVNGQADFVKATFSREAGRVTELVARPLLSLLFPELAHFAQPLSGMIAGTKDILQKVQFDDDYGVDIGIFLDVSRLGARIVEVNIGSIQHKMKPWHQLSSMAREVARAILKRGRGLSLDTLGTINIIRDQMEFAIRETVSSLKKMIVFDMDNTILEGRYIEKSASDFGFQNKLIDIISAGQETFVTTKQIAKLFKGINLAQLLAVVEAIPLVSDAALVIQELKARGYLVGIISDSYDCIANFVKNKVGADFILANELEFSESVATGEVKIPSFFLRSEDSLCSHPICKSNALLQVCRQKEIGLASVIYVGDSDNDTCAVKLAGIGVAFCSSDNVLNMIADQKLTQKSFAPILEFAF